MLIPLIYKEFLKGNKKINQWINEFTYMLQIFFNLVCHLLSDFIIFVISMDLYVIWSSISFSLMFARMKAFFILKVTYLLLDLGRHNF
jgi:hypothetical protein